MTKKGMTLVEMLTVIAVGGVIFSLISSVTIESMRSWRREEKEFSSWRRANAFLDDFTRDARRALPDGFLGYDHSMPESADGFAIMFSGDFSDFDEESVSFQTYTVFYRVDRENAAPLIVREAYLDGRMVSSRGYRGVKSFSVGREDTGVVSLAAYVSGGGEPRRIERKFAFPVYGVSRSDDERI